MRDFCFRMLFASLCIACVVLFIVFAFHPWWQYVVATMVALLASVAVWEYEQLSQEKTPASRVPLVLIESFAIAFSFFLFAKNPPLAGGVLLCSVLVLCASYFRNTEGAIVNTAVSSFPLFYIALPLGMILGVLYFPEGQDGRWWVAYLLVVTKISDIGAYCGGSLWGKRKLAPHISPDKTIVGAAWGLVSALLASFAFHLVGSYFGQFTVGNAEWFFLGLVLGLCGQFGDLAESLFKRDAHKKDSNVLPGIGGALDAVDSLLFNAPIVYLYLYTVR